jgi:plastocyanin
MTIRRAAALFCLGLASFGWARGQAIIAGQVTLARSHSAAIVNKRYAIVAKGGVLAPDPPVAVVYLEGAFPAPASRPTAQMAQKDLAFVPGLLAVQRGTRVEFPNLDDTYHNIFSYSAAKRFDLGRYRSDERPIPSQVFDVAGLVTLRCDIHEHMRALILVVDTPFFVLSEPSGHYRLSGLPSGHYLLKVWLSSQTTLARPVDLAPGATVEANFP